MKYIIISDIHSNFEALSEFSAVISELGNFKSRLVCLGDIIGYGASPSECLSYIEKNAGIILKGNHEKMLLNPVLRLQANNIAIRAIVWTDSRLSDREKEFIGNLPEEKAINNDYQAVHGSPVHPDQYILRESTAMEAIKKMKENKIKICFFGHTHIPGIFDNEARFYYSPNSKIKLPDEGIYLINPGSIGQPRDGDPGASFCIFDDSEYTVVFYRFKYDIALSAKKIKDSGLPEELGERLYYGR